MIDVSQNDEEENGDNSRQQHISSAKNDAVVPVNSCDKDGEESQQEKKKERNREYQKEFRRRKKETQSLKDGNVQDAIELQQQRRKEKNREYKRESRKRKKEANNTEDGNAHDIEELRRQKRNERQRENRKRKKEAENTKDGNVTIFPQKRRRMTSNKTLEKALEIDDDDDEISELQDDNEYMDHEENEFEDERVPNNRELVIHAQPSTSTSRYRINNPTVSNSEEQNIDEGILDQNYSGFRENQSGHKEFQYLFEKNEFGFKCAVCDRLWFKRDLKLPAQAHEQALGTILPNFDREQTLLCSTCIQSLAKNKIPFLAAFNGFKYPAFPENLPPLDIISERLIPPRLPFMQIRRLRHSFGQFGMYGQIINVPVNVNTMVHNLPRNVDDDYCINVHIKKKLIHKTSYLHGLIKKRTVKTWLKCLIATPLYEYYNITINDAFFDGSDDSSNLSLEDVSENIAIEESLIAQQQTLLFNEDKFLHIAPGERNVPQSLLFDEHAEELSFPAIYLGQFRKFTENLRVTPFMMATSELRRSDRRGVTPQHLLYLAMKIMRLRVRDSLQVAFRHVGKNTNITREMIESEEYLNSCIETNLAFLRAIPNSAWYWSARKRDLFAMIRTLGKPTVFLTMSANEIGWPNLLRVLYKLKNNQELTEEQISQMNYMEKSSLINDDAVTCAIYFNKLVNVVMRILQSKKSSPFKQYRVLDYFKRIEFQHRGSPHAHILLWLENSLKKPLDDDYDDAIKLIDTLISVKESEASGNIRLQTHKHTFTCYKRITSNTNQKCRFEAPFMPCPATKILVPMPKDDPLYKTNSRRCTNIRTNLETTDFLDMREFYTANSIESDDDYFSILRAGIVRPRIFYKRLPAEKWHNPFNPFIFNVLKSNMDIQFITEEYSCAAYVVEYINKSNRGISNLQREIITIMDEHPEFDIVDVTKKMSVNILNTVEISSQEAAWYLLREPMSKCSTFVVYIPTVWPQERERIKKTQKELDAVGVGADSTMIWKENCFDKYSKRPEDMENVTLAQFVSKYTARKNGTYIPRSKPRIIRFRNYDIGSDINDYKREMVTLHIPFRNEDEEILAEMKFILTYDENEALILERRKEFESDLDIGKTIEICKKLCRENDEVNEEDVQDLAGRFPEANPFETLYRNPNSVVNSDLHMATLNKLGTIAKKKENIMELSRFIDLMRMSNEKQRSLLIHVINHILTQNSSPLQIFFTGPAGCGKTFVIKLLMEIYNRYTDTDGYCNAYITCASTGKAAVAIDGSTVHTALKISLSKLLPLSIENAQLYRTLFRFVKVLIIDEVSMIGAELLSQIDARLKQITGNFETNFGGLDIILIGDLRQLPPVRATPIYRQPKQRMVGPILWRGLKFYELTQVMRQANESFSSMLTKIGNGFPLTEEELTLIESRFCTREKADEKCPNGVRLFFDNNSVSNYNTSILNASPEKVVSTAIDVYSGYQTAEQLAFVTQKLNKMSVIDTGGLPYEIIFVLGKHYFVTTNVDVSDGIANGAIGTLIHIEQNENNQVTRVWLDFEDDGKTGMKIRTKAAANIQKYNLFKFAVPIDRRTSTISLNNNRTINAKRNHLPIVSACALTIHKSQGGTFKEIVYEYDKKHSYPLLYVALSRVISLEGLYIVPKNSSDCKFYHGRRTAESTISYQDEYHRLSQNRLQTVDGMLLDFLNVRKGLSLFTLNFQSLRKHAKDLAIDRVVRESSILLLSETWLSNEESVDIPNFDCVVKFKRPNERSGGVAVYRNKKNNTHVITPNLDATIQRSDSLTLSSSAIGDVCASECITQDNKRIVIVPIYLSCGKTIKEKSIFIGRSLLGYSRDGINLSQSDEYFRMPMILAGDFNTDFSSDDSKPLVDMLEREFGLKLSNDPKQATTKHGTTLDAVFTRNLDSCDSRLYVSYFSYHKPIVSVIESDFRIEELQENCEPTTESTNELDVQALRQINNEWNNFQF